MTDELSADDKRIRAERARVALADLGWAFDEFEAKLQTSWGETEPSKPHKREVIYHRLKALQSLRGGLQSILNDHENDQVILEHRERTRES